MYALISASMRNSTNSGFTHAILFITSFPSATRIYTP
jgi:hypothetical protein